MPPLSHAKSLFYSIAQTQGIVEIWKAGILSLRSLENLWEEIPQLIQMTNLVFARFLRRERLPFLNKMSCGPSQLLGFAAVQGGII